MRDAGLENNFWQDRIVLVTGHSGFKGNWLTLLLSELGARVHGVSLVPETQPNLFASIGTSHLVSSEFADIQNGDRMADIMLRIQPQIVFHLAAQPLVRRSYLQPIETFSTNVMGTAQVLQASLAIKTLQSIVVVTTDKVYENSSNGQLFTESHPLGGHDPYSASKACAEIVTSSYARSFLNSTNVHMATARAGNVIGGGDWSEDRLIPDAVRAWRSKSNLVVRNTRSVRPWQHVIEPLMGYVQLAQKLAQKVPGLSPVYNFGPRIEDQLSVGAVLELMRIRWGFSLQSLEVRDDKKEAAVLRLDCQLAEKDLQVRPQLSVNEALSWTMDWYEGFYAKPEDAQKLTIGQIHRYMEKLRPEKVWENRNEQHINI